MPFAENIARLTAEHPQHASAIAAWWERWPEMFTGVIAETEAAVAELAARGVPQFALTNMSEESWPGVRVLSSAFSHLRDVVISGAERLIKPDPALFCLTAHRIGYAPEHVLFIDDSAVNCTVAETLGFAVHRFVEPTALRPALVEHGLLEA